MTQRYERQIRFLGEKAQRCLSRSKIAVIGCGALGSTSADMLARAGAGRLLLLDRDFVEENNLHRQSLFDESHAFSAAPKAIAAREVLTGANSEIEIESAVVDLNCGNIEALLEGYDLILDGTDNFETRFLLNDFAFAHGVPWIYGACLGATGVATALVPSRTGCLQCWLEELPASAQLETCDTVGILSPVVHAVSAFQVMEAIKLLTEAWESPEMLQVNLWETSWRSFSSKVSKRGDCRCCGRREFRFLTGTTRSRQVRLCGRNAIQFVPAQPSEVAFEEVYERLRDSGRIEFNQYMMKIQIDSYQIALFPDGRSIIKGTDDPAIARALYAKYLGA